jgi:hypothetical protein
MHNRERERRDEIIKRAANAEGTGTMTREERLASHSPKRKADLRWQTGRETEDERASGRDARTSATANKARSLYPKRRSKESDSGGSKIAMQKFIYQFMTGITGKQDAYMESLAGEMQEEGDRQAEEGTSRTADKKNSAPIRQTDHHGWTEAAEERGFAVMKVTSPKDKGAFLAS